MDAWICDQIRPSVLWLRLRLCRLIWSTTVSLETGIAWITLGCGIQLSRSEQLFLAFPGAYSHLGAIAPEPTWSVILLILGSAHGTSLLIGSRRGRRIVLMALVIVWWAMAGLFWSSIPGGMMPAMASAVAMMCTWSFARLGGRD